MSIAFVGQDYGGPITAIACGYGGAITALPCTTSQSSITALSCREGA